MKADKINPAGVAPSKAEAEDFKGRFREIISDPLNLLIERQPFSGCVVNGKVYLHNGLLVPCDGPNSYYGTFSDILVINRGVHEPLEEFCFQQALKILGKRPRMLELGAYWAHYSMWLKKQYPEGEVVLVEADEDNLRAGKENLEFNGLEGIIIKASVGNNSFKVDDWMQDDAMKTLSILHADIQGHEIEMLHGAVRSLESRLIERIFLSTHSQQLHHEAIKILNESGYCVEVSSDFENESTSYDGFIMASSPCVPEVLKGFQPWSRLMILKASVQEKTGYCHHVNNLINKKTHQI